jgi:hypothetical protein
MCFPTASSRLVLVDTRCPRASSVGNKKIRRYGASNMEMAAGLNTCSRVPVLIRIAVLRIAVAAVVTALRLTCRGISVGYTAPASLIGHTWYGPTLLILVPIALGLLSAGIKRTWLKLSRTRRECAAALCLLGPLSMSSRNRAIHYQSSCSAVICSQAGHRSECVTLAWLIGTMFDPSSRIRRRRCATVGTCSLRC